VERATALLLHGMQQSEIPVSQLSDALARMARTLSDLGTPLFGADDPANPTSPEKISEMRVVRDALARDIAVCIQSLQFHDRLMQQLTQARDILTGLAANRLLARIPNVPANEGGIEGSIELF
jgi:hypothetical protein